jgi:sigma-B regulation protein RsbU (phosphoserine phosphatase)
MRILVAEDDPMQRLVLVELLKKHGHEVTSAPDGDAAWEALIESGSSLVFTDWMMPRMNGLELIRKIRETAFGRYVYVILCTSRGSRADLIEGMKSGADDYVEKPVYEEELLARLGPGKRVIDLEERLENDKRRLAATNRSLSNAYETMRKDLDAAARMQRSLLPAPCTIQGLRCDSLFLPASAVAGDVFNFFPLNASSTGFYLLDVSGHGIPAAMLSVTLSKMLSSRPSQGSPLVQTASDGITYELRPPNEAVAELNRRFQDQGDMYFTMVYGLLDKYSRRLQIVQAGHPVPVLLRRGKPPIALGDGGFPVGMLPDMSYDLLEYTMEQGDRLFLCSDGITECANQAQEQFGFPRFIDFLDRHRYDSLDALLKAMELTIRSWGGSADFADDVSLLALELDSLPGDDGDRATLFGGSI